MKINDGHFLELMDRLHVQSCMVEEHLVKHPLTKRLKRVKKLINKASWSLLEAHQVVREKSNEKDERKNSIEKVILRRRKKS